MDILVVLVALPALYIVCDIAMSHLAVMRAKRVAKHAHEQYERVCKECDRNQILLSQRGAYVNNLCRMRKHESHP